MISFVIFSPSTDALEAAVMITNSTDYGKHSVTKREYDEHGESICHRKFSLEFQ